MKHIEHIVLIDDNEVTNFFNQDILLSMDPSWRITAFTEPDQALTYFEDRMNSGPISESMLVFLDIKMPECTGFDLVRELEERDLVDPLNMQFCMLTSSTLLRDLEDLHKFPMIRHYLEKPLNAEKVQRVLEHSRSVKK
jgi:CheY-like chemotaxis protein